MNPADRNTAVLEFPIEGPPGSQITLHLDRKNGTVHVRGARVCCVWTVWDKDDSQQASGEGTEPDEIGVSVASKPEQSIEIELVRTAERPWWRNFASIRMRLFNFGKGFEVPGAGWREGTKVALIFGGLYQLIAQAPFKGAEHLDPPPREDSLVG